jgi:hypothetical protein
MPVKLTSVLILPLLLVYTLGFAGQAPSSDPETDYSGMVEESRGILLQSADEGGAHTVLLAEGQPIPRPKDPFVAGLLSFFMLGVGQIYAKEYTKGSLFIAAGLVDKLSLILLISHINNKYGPEGDELVNIDWKSFDNSTRFLVISYITASLGLRVFCVVDAVSSTKKFNERYFSTSQQSTTNLSFDDEQLKLQFNLNFSD